MITEAQLSHDVQAALGSLPDVRLFRMQVGTARDRATGQVVRFGLPGMADWLVVVGGVVCGWLELKSTAGRQRPDQARFEQAIARNGGVYRIARSVDEALALVAELRAILKPR